MPRPERTTPEDGAPAPTTVLLVRHGATPTTGKELPGRAPGLHLSETGRTQARTAAEKVRPLLEGEEHRRVAAIYASPLERTQETAAPLADALGLPVQVEDGLIELDVGDWTGLELEKARELPEWRTVQRYPSGFRFPGGESFLEMQVRVLGTLERLRAAHPARTVVAVSHADPIRAVVAHALGVHLDLFQRVAISPCSLTAVSYGDAGPVVLAVNTGDLATLTGP